MSGGADGFAGNGTNGRMRGGASGGTDGGATGPADGGKANGCGAAGGGNAARGGAAGRNAASEKRMREGNAGMMHIVLLSGGSGTRLWPLSNEARSKQFLKVLRDGQGRPESMVQRTFRKISEAGAPADVTVATSESQAQPLALQVPGGYRLVAEPERRDTAPAILLACAHLAWEQGAGMSDSVVAMPIDAYTEDSYYGKLLELDAAVRSGAGDIVLLGVEPSFPSPKYGYVVPAAPQGSPRAVARFVEKPDRDLAAELMGQGALWNCGVFAFRLSHAMGLLAGYGDFRSFADLRARYAELPKNSFDYEVVERAGSVAVVPCETAWKDLGTWNTLTEEMAEPYAGRVAVDGASCGNVHAINETGLPLAVAGLRDAVVVATPDGILVSGKRESACIKDLVGRAKAGRPMYEQRRWGEYRVVDSGSYPDGAKALTKELVIREGKQLSYQRHARRSEVWTVVSGHGEVVLDGLVREVRAGSVVDIRAGQMHAARAFEDLHVMEVQVGDELTEEDIERFGDWWGRPPARRDAGPEAAGRKEVGTEAAGRQGAESEAPDRRDAGPGAPAGRDAAPETPGRQGIDSEGRQR